MPCSTWNLGDSPCFLQPLTSLVSNSSKRWFIKLRGNNQQSFFFATAQQKLEIRSLCSLDCTSCSHLSKSCVGLSLVAKYRNVTNLSSKVCASKSGVSIEVQRYLRLTIGGLGCWNITVCSCPAPPETSVIRHVSCSRQHRWCVIPRSGGFKNYAVIFSNIYFLLPHNKKLKAVHFAHWTSTASRFRPFN